MSAVRARGWHGGGSSVYNTARRCQADEGRRAAPRCGFALRGDAEPEQRPAQADRGRAGVPKRHCQVGPRTAETPKVGRGHRRRSRGEGAGGRDQVWAAKQEVCMRNAEGKRNTAKQTRGTLTGQTAAA
ncbi:hypothetical protein TRVL_06280 [Trypanosoma vivax]|nr:hypothetical protein TRVL_06280 [Trypanosoma vivax]